MKEQWIKLIDLYEDGDDEQAEDMWFKLTSAEQKEFIMLLENKFVERKYDSMYKFYKGLDKMTKIHWQPINMN
jgi:hypothetical protein